MCSRDHRSGLLELEQIGQQRAVRQPHAFGQAGGAGREGQGGKGIGIGPRTPRGLGVGAGQQGGEGDCAFGLAERNYLQVGCVASGLAHRGQQPGRGEHEVRIDLVQLVRQVGRAAARVGAAHDPACRHRTERGDRPFRRVRGEHQQHVTGPQTQARQAGGTAADQVVQRAVGVAAAAHAVDQRHGIGPLAGPGAQPARQGQRRHGCAQRGSFDDGGRDGQHGEGGWCGQCAWRLMRWICGVRNRCGGFSMQPLCSESGAKSLSEPESFLNRSPARLSWPPRLHGTARATHWLIPA